MNLDASSFDSGQRGLLRDLQAYAIKKICPSAYDFWRAVVMNPNHMTSRKGVTVHSTCCKNSGELDTASGNTLLTLLMLIDAFEHFYQGLVETEGLPAFGEGDDNTLGAFQ